MKKRGFMIFALLMLLSLIFPCILTTANPIIITGYEFLAKNIDNCVFRPRYYYVNVEGGVLSVKIEPGAVKETTKLSNGRIVEVSHTYNHNGELWGIVFYSYNHSNSDGSYGSFSEFTGWVPMDQLLVKYDYISFEEDYRDEIYDYSGSIEELLKSDHIVCWTWPGSGEITEVLEDRQIKNLSSTLIPSYAYRDSEEREWGFITNRPDLIKTSYSVSWVCLSDPLSKDISAFNPAPEPTLRQLETTNPKESETERTHDINIDLEPVAITAASSDTLSPLLLIIILVIGLATASFTLIIVFWKKRKL